MWESPITVATKETRIELENGIYKAIIEHGVHVEKDELIKALQYDRDQYNKGYEDGVKVGMMNLAEKAKDVAMSRLINKGMLNVFDIDNILIEMLGDDNG